MLFFFRRLKAAVQLLLTGRLNLSDLPASFPVRLSNSHVQLGPNNTFILDGEKDERIELGDNNVIIKCVSIRGDGK